MSTSTNGNRREPGTPEPAGQAASGGEQQQFLTFMLGSEQFAIGILGIKEIIEYATPTEVPMMPKCIRGVINIRGAVVPVLDLAARFGRKAAAVSKRTAIVIVELGQGDERHDMGVIVDAVNAVLEISPSEIEPPPTFGTRIRTDFIYGMGKVDGKFVILLNVEQVLSSDEISALAQVDTLVEATADEVATK